PLHLDYVIRGEVLEITSRLRAMGPPVVTVYPVGDLLGPAVPAGAKLDDPQQLRRTEGALSGLADVIVEKVEPNLWSENGGPGSISYHPGTGSLVVRQVPPVHEAVREFLAARREAE